MTTTYRWRAALVFSLLSVSVYGFSVVPPRCLTRGPAGSTFRTASTDDDEETTAAAPLEEEVAPAAVEETTPTATSTDSSRPTIGSAAPCTIKVIGVGGGGGNAINHMVQSTNNNNNGDDSGVAFLSINTDAQALSTTQAATAVNIGQRTTRGLGAGGDPATGTQAALESIQELEKLCEGADMVFITAGMVCESVSCRVVLLLCSRSSYFQPRGRQSNHRAPYGTGLSHMQDSLSFFLSRAVVLAPAQPLYWPKSPRILDV